MRIGVLGTGVVGETIGAKLVQLGHEVRMGSRSTGNEKAAAWAAKAGERASHGTFADAAAFGELLFNCTQIQRAFPHVKVVKTLNTMNALVMVDPSRVAGRHDVFVSGDDAGAKARAVELLRSFGWERPIDLGDITTARGTEMLLPIWVRLYAALQTGDFIFAVVHA